MYIRSQSRNDRIQRDIYNCVCCTEETVRHIRPDQLTAVSKIGITAAAAGTMMLVTKFIDALTDTGMGLIVMMLINWAPKAIEMRERLFSKFKKKEA